MNTASIVVLSLVIICFIISCKKVIKDNKCGGGCGGCSSCNKCSHYMMNLENKDDKSKIEK